MGGRHNKELNGIFDADKEDGFLEIFVCLYDGENLHFTYKNHKIVPLNFCNTKLKALKM